jgi:hypothetical protein
VAALNGLKEFFNDLRAVFHGAEIGRLRLGPDLESRCRSRSGQTIRPRLLLADRSARTLSR